MDNNTSKFLFRLLFPAALSIWLATTFNIVLGLVVLLVALVYFWGPAHLSYARKNPKHYWFKRKIFGWGWTPVTWQGWLVTLGYLVAIISLALWSVDPGQKYPPFEFIIFFTIFTGVFISIAYKKGEEPKWQWGEPLRKNKDIRD